MRWVFMFKASGLQSYIFATNKLREVAGASQLIAHLADKYLLAALDELGFEPGQHVEILQKAAGQATLLFEQREDARRFYRLWPLLVAQLAPGVETHQWMGAVEEGGLFDALKEGWAALRALRNARQPLVPELTPPVLRAARTSGAATRFAHDDKQFLDRPSARKRDVEAQNPAGLHGFEPVDVREEWAGRQWAADLSEIVRGERNYLGVIHADGNRLGGFLLALADSIARDESAQRLEDAEIVALYRGFSEALARATRQAALEALSQLESTQLVESQPLPARPVVVGGDDVTLIVPAQDALGVCAHFLRRFEVLSAEFLAELARKYRLSVFEQPRARKFTACAGIVYQRAPQPLLTSYQNAEELCGWAKARSRQTDQTTVGSVMFARTIDSSQVDFERRQANGFVDPVSKMPLTAGPYSTEEVEGFVSLQNLRDLSVLHRELSHGSVRGLVDALHKSAAQADWALQRLVAVHGRRGDRFQQWLRRVGMRLKERQKQEQINKEAKLRAELDSDEPIVMGLSILPDTSILEFVRAK